MKRHLAAALLFVACVCHADTDVNIKPESWVHISNKSFSCMSKDQVSTALNHAYHHEKTLFAAMFSMDDQEGYCVQMSTTDTKFLVLSVASSSSTGITDMLQVAPNGKVKSAMWISGEGATLTSN